MRLEIGYVNSCWPTLVGMRRSSAETKAVILTAARELRERAGTLSGYAAGMTADRPVRDVLGDVLAVMGERPGMQWEALAVKLAERWPDRWDGVNAESISADCRALGVPSVDVKAFGRALKGCRKTDVEQAAGR